MSTIKDKETEILKAAEEVFLEKGFVMAKTTEIAGKAGVTHAMLNYYYRSKEKIFTTIFEKKVAEFVASMEVNLPDNIPFLELVKRGIETHFDFIAKNPKLPRFLLQELSSNPSRAAAVRKMAKPMVEELHGKIAHRLQAAIEKGEMREIEPFQLLYNIASVNVFVFLTIPTLAKVIGISKKEYNAFLEKRRAENVELILSRLRI